MEPPRRLGVTIDCLRSRRWVSWGVVRRGRAEVDFQRLGGHGERRAVAVEQLARRAAATPWVRCGACVGVPIAPAQIGPNTFGCGSTFPFSLRPIRTGYRRWDRLIAGSVLTGCGANSRQKRKCSKSRIWCPRQPLRSPRYTLVHARLVLDPSVFSQYLIFFSARTGLLGGTWSLAFGYACSIRPFPHSRVAPARFLHPCPRSGAGLARFLDFR